MVLLMDKTITLPLNFFCNVSIMATSHTHGDNSALVNDHCVCVSYVPLLKVV